MKGFEEYFPIQKKTPIFDIKYIEFHLLVKRIFLSPIDLSESGDTGFDGEYAFLGELILLDFTRLMRTRPDKAHISHKDIQELREFVDRVFFDKCSDFHLSGVIFYLVQRTMTSGRSLDELFFKLECVVVGIVDAISFFDAIFPLQIAKLIESKAFPVLSDANIFVQYRTARVFEFDENADNNKKW